MTLKVIDDVITQVAIRLRRQRIIILHECYIIWQYLSKSAKN